MIKEGAENAAWLHEGARVGYARVSTVEQSLALQLDALTSASCERIFTEKAGGAKADRPELAALLAYLRPGDVLVVWKLDRLGRSLRDLVNTVTELGERGIEFQSLTEGIDTTTPAGRLTFGIFAALAEFERSLIQERTRAGLAAARARGRNGGRPRVMNEQRTAAARKLLEDGMTYQQAADTLGVSRATVVRAVNRS